MPTAIVTGATGMTGSAIVDALSSDPQWTKIHALSRSQKIDYPSTVVHDTLDLQSNAKEMAKQLEGVEADYIFFCAYLAKEDEQEACDVNGAMLLNFLDALSIIGADKRLKRFILTTGLKQYGVHLGRPKTPMVETDPWLEGEDWPPNFYYIQQRILKKAAEGKHWDWVVTYPQDVIGYARGNFMNMATALGLYAAVCKALPGSELPYPGSPDFYLMYNCWTSSKLHAQFFLWASQADGVGNQAFNVTNGDTESWQNMWPKVAKLFGCKVPEKMFDGDSYKDFEGSVMSMAERPPIDVVASEIGMKGAFGPSLLEQRIDMTKWAKKPEVVEAYKKIQKEYDLEEAAWEKATWGFLAFILSRNYSCVVSMSKARKFGWTGYEDTWDSLEDTFRALEREGIFAETELREGVCVCVCEREREGKDCEREIPYNPSH